MNTTLNTPNTVRAEGDDVAGAWTPLDARELALTMNTLMSCGHTKRYEYKATEDSVSLCTLCSMDRWRKHCEELRANMVTKSF